MVTVHKIDGIVGSIVPVGESAARWMFVTRADDESVWGRMWSARSQRWTKTDAWYSRKVVWKRRPNCPKPSAPKTNS